MKTAPISRMPAHIIAQISQAKRSKGRILHALKRRQQWAITHSILSWPYVSGYARCLVLQDIQGSEIASSIA
jgi:hypothetical protein